MYQIDRRMEDGKLQGYEMIKAANAAEALEKYLGDDFEDYKVEKKHINGRVVYVATCPEETSEYLEVTKVIE